MSEPKSVQAFAFQNGGAACMARIRGLDGQLITQASLTSITCNVFDLDGDDPTTASSTPSVVIASTVFDTLQESGGNGPRWNVDSTGFNWLFVLPDTTFATAGHRYAARFKFEPTSGEAFFIPEFLFKAKRTF